MLAELNEAHALYEQLRADYPNRSRKHHKNEAEQTRKCSKSEENYAF
jgi:hypothetical protein